MKKLAAITALFSLFTVVVGIVFGSDSDSRGNAVLMVSKETVPIYAGFSADYQLDSSSEPIFTADTDAPNISVTDEPESEPSAPAVEADPPTVETKPPAVETTPGIIETDAPAVETAPPVIETTAPTVINTDTSVVTEPVESMVWIPKSGKKYHSKSSCSNMKNPSQVTLSTAKQRGYEPCKKCY